jgi:serine/threonine-protein kinase
MARILVRQAAGHAQDTRALYALLADHIDDPKERERFARLGVPEASGSRPVAQPTTASRGTRSLGAQPTAGTRTRAPRPLEQPFVDRTTARLAVYLGPIAKVVARKAAQQAHDCDEFVRLVAEHIGTQERDTFLRDVEAPDKPER